MTHAQSTQKGCLYIVATPIGNLDDITLRAIEVLKSVDCILAEDTRHSQQLLTALGIKNKLVSLHAHNENEKSQSFIDELIQGKTFALISDAGTPLISDPGYPIVKLARQNQITVIPIPGPSAITAALSAAGAPCDSFLFVGFLPAKHQARVQELTELKSKPHTVVFYESTHRIKECINDIIEVYGSDYCIILAKELTKSHERFINNTAEHIKNWLLMDPGHPKGEFVIIIPYQKNTAEINAHDGVLQILLKELPLKQAVSIASQLTHANKNELYDRALLLKAQN